AGSGAGATAAAASPERMENDTIGSGPLVLASARGESSSVASGRLAVSSIALSTRAPSAAALAVKPLAVKSYALVSGGTSPAKLSFANRSSARPSSAQASSAKGSSGQPSSAKPSACASLTIFLAVTASASAEAGGATPSNSSSLAIKYPSSFRLPMIKSPPSLTPLPTLSAPSCQAR